MYVSSFLLLFLMRNSLQNSLLSAVAFVAAIGAGGPVGGAPSSDLGGGIEWFELEAALC